MIVFKKVLCDLARGAERYNELGAFANLAFDTNGASHLLDKLLADAQAQANTILVYACIFFYCIEVDEELRNVLLRHSQTEILND